MRSDDSSNRSKFARYNLRPVLHCRREAPSFGDEGAIKRTETRGYCRPRVLWLCYLAEGLSLAPGYVLYALAGKEQKT